MRRPGTASPGCRRTRGALAIISPMQPHVSLAGEAGTVDIVRGEFGVPQVRAQAAVDAWFGMGYACAQDRLFQLDYDRRRACGRWAEIAGRSAVGADILSRRLL